MERLLPPTAVVLADQDRFSWPPKNIVRHDAQVQAIQPFAEGLASKPW